ncbi:MAG: hypothetical protein H6Q19_1125 [Bacteroidetes bacterium]|nr:hypothetical protein [Bacteroidota bacterium]
MKTRIQILTAILLTATLAVNAQTQAVKDTTLFFNQKQILVTDSSDQVKVQVFKTDTTEYKKIYEGIFTDGNSFEKYSVETQFGFDFPFNKRKRTSKFAGHFTGFGLGTLITTENFINFNDAGGIKADLSNEFTFSPIGYTVPIINGYAGITTGIGMTWRNLHLGNNTHLVNNNGITTPEPAPEGITYYSSRLRAFGFNMPLYLEIHPLGKSDFYIMGGALLGINTFTSYKVKYKTDDDTKIKKVEGKDYNVNPFSLSYLVEMGWDDLGVYAKYTPTPLFKNDKGPDIQVFSAGLSLKF